MLMIPFHPILSKFSTKLNKKSRNLNFHPKLKERDGQRIITLVSIKRISLINLCKLYLEKSDVTVFSIYFFWLCVEEKDGTAQEIVKSPPPSLPILPIGGWGGGMRDVHPSIKNQEQILEFRPRGGRSSRIMGQSPARMGLWHSGMDQLPFYNVHLWIKFCNINIGTGKYWRQFL